MSKEALWEMVKEAGRIAFFAGVSAVVAYFTDKLKGLDPTSTYVVIGTVFFRLVDKYIHENKSIKASGIAPF